MVPGKENSSHPMGGPRSLTLKSLDIFRKDTGDRRSIAPMESSRDFPDYTSNITANESVFSQSSHTNMYMTSPSVTASLKKRAPSTPQKTLDQVHNGD